MIRNGHGKLSDVQNYTLAQFIGFLKDIRRQDIERSKGLFDLVSVAVSGNDEARKTFWKKLNGRQSNI